MPGPSLDLEMRMKDQKVAFALDALAAKEEKIDQGLGKVARSAKQAETDLARFAKRTEEIHGAPVERFADRFRKLEQAFASGKLSLVAYTNAMSSTRKELAEAQAAFDGTAVKAKEAADVARKADQDKAATASWYEKVRTRSMKLAYELEEKEAKEAAALSKQLDQQKAAQAVWYEKMRTKSMKLAYDLEEKEAKEAAAAAREQERSWQATIGPVTALAASYVSLQSAVRLVGDAFRYAREQSKDALNSMQNLDESRRKLAQLAATEAPGTLAKWNARIDAAAAASGVKRDQASDIFFQMKSFGREGEFESILGMQQLVNPSEAALLATKVNRMFGDKYTGEQIVSAAIEAGRESEADVGQFASALASAQEGGQRIGATLPESLAILSEIASYYHGKGESGGSAVLMAGNRLRVFGHKMATRMPELGDVGTLPAFDAFEKMSAGDQAEFVKENEELGSVIEAIRTSRGRIGTVEQRVSRELRLGGTPGGLLAAGLGVLANDPKARASLDVQRANLEKEVIFENVLAVPEAERQAAAARAKAKPVAEHAGILRRGATEVGVNAALAVEANGATVSAAGDHAGKSGLYALFGHFIAANEIGKQLVARGDEQVDLLRELRDAWSGGRTRAIEADAMSHPR